MDGSGETAAQQRVKDLQAQLAAAEADAAAEAAPEKPLPEPAPGDGTRPQDGIAAGTAEGTGAIAAAPAAEAEPSEKPVLDMLKELGPAESPHGFVENLRTVADRLEADGRLVLTDTIGSAESGKITAALIKVVGELTARL